MPYMMLCRDLPLAYFEVRENGDIRYERLIDHSTAVACLASRVFGERLRRSLANEENLSAVLDKVLNISAYLHDLGKASDYYQVQVESIKKRFGSLSFWLHHIVSSLVLYESYIMKTDPILRYASEIVLRHHRAMKTTVEDLCEERRKDVIINAIKRLNEKWITSLLDNGIDKGYIDEDRRNLILEAVSEMKRLRDKDIINRCAYRLRSSLTHYKSAEAKLIISVSGAVIISDIVISGIVRGGIRALANIWLREIPNLEREARNCINLQSDHKI